MMHRLTIAATCACLLAGPADAASLTFSGFLNDPGNGALRGSDVMPSPPSFTDDWEIANNVAVHAFNLPVAGLVSFDSQGFAAGGADPYFTLFAGSDDSATVAGSNYGQPVAGDFLLTFALPAGDYQVAMGVFANMSFAENYGTGTLGEGFTRLGGPDSLGSSYYKLVVTTEAVPTPEPAALLLLAFGLTSLLLVPRRMNPGRGL